MNKPRVFLCEQDTYDLHRIAEHMGGIITGLGINPTGKSVLLKPSFVYPSQSPSVLGVITHPAFVAGAALALKELGARSVGVGESSVIGPARLSFRTVGVLPLLKGVARPVYLDEADQVDVKVDNALVQDSFRVPRPLMDADLYVSLPKIKTNMFAEVTLSVKNNLGLLRQYDRLVYHDYRLHKKLADLYRVRPPDLVLSDCIVAGEGQGPMMARPVELGLILGGDNAVATDVVACRLTGFDPAEVEHLRLLIEAGMGPPAIEDIDIRGAALLSRARKFSPPDSTITGLSPKLHVFEGTEVSCPWGCRGLIRGVVDAYTDIYGPEEIAPMNVILGKPVDGIPADLDPDRTLVLGDCAAPHKDRGHFVGGCCPRPLDIGMVVRRIMGPVKVEIGFAGAMRAYTGHNLWRLSRFMRRKKLEPIENHLPFTRVIKEYIQMTNLQRKQQGK